MKYQEKISNEIHIEGCNGTYKEKIQSWSNTYELEIIEIDSPCTCDHVTYSHDYILYTMKIGKCYGMNRNWYRDFELVEKMLETKHNCEIYKYRQIPKWDGQDFVWEVCYTAGDWFYLKKTGFDKIPNIWTPSSDEEQWDVYSKASRIVNFNLRYLSDNDFVCKRANVYECTQADINKMFNKLKKKTNGIKNK